jgi:DNA-directed RNA polymerase subunit N (RpoN/RPB10)
VKTIHCDSCGEKIDGPVRYEVVIERQDGTMNKIKMLDTGVDDFCWRCIADGLVRANDLEPLVRAKNDRSETT